MTLIGFDGGQCKRIRSYLDSYLNNELLVETTHEVIKHLESCKDCARVLEERTRIKDQLKRAVLGDSAPLELQARILHDIRRGSRPGFLFGALNKSWVLAAAAAVLFGAIALGIVFKSTGRPTNVAPRPLSLAAEVASGDQTGQILKVGFDDHVFCSIDHDMADKQFTSEQMSASLGPQYEGLVAVVKQKMPQDYVVVVGHRCHYLQREFVHLILRRGNEVVSLILTKKNGEVFPPGGAASFLQASGAPVYESAWHDLQVAGMETPDYLVFVISNESRKGNEYIADTLMPAVNDFLKNAAA
ncbi:MAG TPA: zf-HC2 domain-containing protein [Blastocatellia bacterium]|nr:zf-HC2 domain-containing protein [Blastocatellia bacterium]